MIIRGADPILISDIGYFNRHPVKNYGPEKENRRVRKILDEEKQKVHSIYYSNKKVISHNSDGRRLNVIV